MRLAIAVGVVASAVSCISTPVSAQVDKFHVTPEEHAACDDDAARLCSDAYPDENKLLDCMRMRVNQLSPACAATFRAGLRKRHMRM